MSKLALRARISPWLELDELQDRMSRLMHSVPGFEGEGLGSWSPALDMAESDAEFTLTAEVPGLAGKDIQMEVENGVLTLKGEKKSEREEKGDKDRWHIVERSYGSFQRSLTLPPAVDASKIKAESSNGVLTVHLPKRAESAAQRIAIEDKK